LAAFDRQRVFNGEETMTDSQRLLADYATNGSEPAFRELVSRYLNLVYSTAVRLTGGDTHLAQDAAQTVFVDLARKARTLPRDVMLGGWLHRHTCFVASKIVRGERRRQSRERQAVAMNEQQDYSEANLAQVAPLLDEAINQLGAEDRTAILLRFFEQRDLRSVGEALGGTENAAQKRVSRALEELRGLLKNRGVVFSAAALGTALAGEAVSAAPAGLAVTISGVALAGATAGTGTTLTLLKLMTATQFKLSIGALVVAGAVTTFVIQHQAQEKLRADNESLRQQITQFQSDNLSLSRREAVAKLMLRLPAPPWQAVAAPAPLAEDSPATNLIARFLKEGEVPRLTHEQVEAYLKSNGRTAANLLAAFQASGDPALMQEAMKTYPNDPQVDFRAALDKALSPEEQRQWLNAFEKSAPDNALANYLSALNYFGSGQNDQAVQELNAAAGKSQFQDYFQDAQQSLEEAYLAAGYSVADAEMMGPAQIQLPQLAALRQLGLNMVSLAGSYQQAGDPASAQSMLQMAVNLGQHLNDPFLITSLVGMAIERNALGAMNPASLYGSTGQTVQDQLNQLTQQRTTLMNINDQFQHSVAPVMSEPDWISYEQRRTLFSETAAQQWAIGKYGQP
jgi:RNA polymerase sigma factor (sigma-70 family)